MSDKDVGFYMGGFCGSALACLIFFFVHITSEYGWHEIVMDQARVEAYRTKQQAEAVLRGQQ